MRTSSSAMQLSRRLFVRRGLETSVGIWLAPLLACGDDDATGAGDAATNADAAIAHDASVEAGAPSGDAGDETDAGVDAGRAEPGSCEPFLTPVAAFFAAFGGADTEPGWQKPNLEAEEYRLTIDGEVGTTLTLSLADLLAMTPQRTVLKTMQCVFGQRGTGLFSGVPLRTVLDAAGIDKSRTNRILFHGHDGFRNNLRLEDVYPGGGATEKTRFEPLLALQLNGEPLPRDLGRPVRLVLSDRFGFQNVKWLTRIEASGSDVPFGQYQELGFAGDDAVIPPNAPFSGTYRVRAGAAGAITLCGRAQSGTGRIASIDVSLDGGDFEQARIVPLAELLAQEPRIAAAQQVAEGWEYPFLGVATPWEHDFVATPGEHTIALRVRDTSGAIGDGYRAVLVFDGAGADGDP